MQYVVQMRAGIKTPEINVEYIMDIRYLGVWKKGEYMRILQ